TGSRVTFSTILGSSRAPLLEVTTRAKEAKAKTAAANLIRLIKPGFESGVNEQPTFQFSCSYGTCADLKVNFDFMIEVRYECGVHLPRQDLWLDPRDARRFAFVSHAHSDHIAPHKEIIVSERTARLMQSRLPGPRTEHILPFGERGMVHALDLMLLPAGHIFGSAQFFLFAGNETLLYTGDFKLRSGKSAEPAEWRKADTLIMETTFGVPRYRFPPTEEVVDQIVAFCRETIEDNRVPVLLGYSLGKAQEILCSLDGAGLTPMLHGSVYQMTRIYELFGQSFCKY